MDVRREQIWVVLAAGMAALALVPLAAAWELAPDLGHGWAAPLLIAFLWWERWQERPRARGEIGGGGGAGGGFWAALAVALVCAVPLRLLLAPYPLWSMALVLYLVLLLALVLVAAHRLAGWAGVAWVGGPLLILFGVVPWPGVLDRTLILPLREGLAELVAELNNLFGRPALASGTSVRLASGWVGIDEACGGMRSMQASVTAALFFGEWFRFRAGWRGGLLIAAVCAAVLGNLGRVLTLAWCVGSSPEALERWHDPAGWAALGFSLVATGVAAWALRRRGAGRTEPTDPRGPDAGGRSGEGGRGVVVSGKSIRGALRWSLAALAGLAVIEGGVRLWYARGAARERETVARWAARLPVERPGYAARPLGDAAREMLRPDGYESGGWRGADGRERGAYHVEWRRGQVARSAPFLHNPTICLPYTGCELVEALGEFRVVWEGGEIPFQAYVFRYMNREMTVAFTIWDTARGRGLVRMDAGIGGWWESQWRDVREARQHQPAQLLSFTLEGREGVERMAEEISALIVPDRAGDGAGAP